MIYNNTKQVFILFDSLGETQMKSSFFTFHIILMHNRKLKIWNSYAW